MSGPHPLRADMTDRNPSSQIERRRKGRARRQWNAVIEGLEVRQLLAAPSALEQEMLELINQMRVDPQGEFSRLISQANPIRSPILKVEQALFNFRVNGTLLQQQFSALTPAAPLAWNEKLEDAAAGHNQVMIQQDRQDHQLPGEPWIDQRVRDAGYNFSAVGENVYAYAYDVLYGHAAFAIDWGSTPTGIQATVPHRTQMMNPAYREVGIAITADNNSQTSVGPYLITQDFGTRPGSNPFVLGVAYRDLNGDGRYNAGEGLSGVKVQISGSGGTFSVDAYNTGGYQKEVPPGSYTVTFTGGGLTSPITKQVTIGQGNAKVDLVLPKDLNPPVGQVGASKVQLTQSAYWVGEGAGSIIINVTLDRPQANKTVTVDYSMGGGSATAGTDYQASSGRLVFPPGVTSRTFTIPIYSDGAFEGDENFYLGLFNPSDGAVLGSLAGALVTIGDDDPRPAPAQPVGATLVPGPGRTLAAVEVTFNQPLDPGSAWDASNYDLRVAGNNRAIAFRVASYDATTNTVRLVPTGRVSLTTAVSLRVVGSTDDGLRGLNGLLVDGNRDGRDGGDYEARLAKASGRVIGRPRGPLRPAAFRR